MVTVKRLNVVLDIEDEDLSRYLKMGYNQIDPLNGKVIAEGMPNDMGSLMLAYKQKLAEIDKLKAEIEQLIAENEQLKAKPKTAKSKKSE